MSKAKSIILKILLAFGIVAVICVGVFIYVLLTTNKKVTPPKKEYHVYYPLLGTEVELTTKESLSLGSSPSALDIYSKKLEKIKNRPISIKIVNDYIARPQEGLNEADVIFETMIEGGESRFNAVFHSTIPSRVGPVRSARYSDTYIVPWVSSILCYSGSNKEVNAQLKDFSIDYFNQSKGGSLFKRIPERYSPYNLYIYPGKNGADLYKVAKEHEYKISVDVSKIKLFFNTLKSYYKKTNKAFLNMLELSPEATSLNVSYEKLSKFAIGENPKKFYLATADSIEADFSGLSRCTWKYDTKSGLYYRWQEDKEHIDAYSNTQLNTKNVVIMYAKYPEAKSKDPAGNPTYKTILTGTGEAVFLRNGYIIKGTWEASNSYKPIIRDANGVIIPLAKGRTYYQIIDKSWGIYKVNSPK